MTRKYLEGKFTPSPGVGLDTTEIEDAKFVFNEEASSFSEPPLIGTVDLYSGDTLLKQRYTMAMLEDGSYADIEYSFLLVIKTNNLLTDMEIKSGSEEESA